MKNIFLELHQKKKAVIVQIGFECRKIISTVSDLQQYAYGLEAGKILKNIHQVPVLDTDV